VKALQAKDPDAIREAAQAMKATGASPEKLLAYASAAYPLGQATAAFIKMTRARNWTMFSRNAAP
jgi:predicted Zn-dependent protease